MKTKNILSNLFLIVAVILVVAAAVFAFTGDKGAPDRFFLNLKIFQVTTGSMEPYMQVDGIVIVKKAALSDFAVGDVVSFVRGGDAIAHRVIALTPDGLQTKGDNNHVADTKLVTQEEVIGKCVFVMNWVATFLHRLETPTGIVKVVVLPLLFLIVLFLGVKYLEMVKVAKKTKNSETSPVTKEE